MNKYSWPLSLKQISIDDQYWNRYTRLIPEAVLPYQWLMLNDQVPDTPPSYCLNNFKIAAGEQSGERKGTIFQDSDIGKWLEAVAYSLASKPDPQLEQRADEVIALIGRAQCADGYLNTYYTLVEPDRRWSNLTEGHELYCAGHLIEAAVAYFETTGKRELLDILCRYADLICKVFGPEEDQIHGVPGHSEIELALVRLFRVTGERRYADMAKYFVDERGKSPYFLEEIAHPDYKNIFPEMLPYDLAYSQAHAPVRQQDTAEGHAVRAVYLYCAMADLAELYDDFELLERCKILWDNMVEKKMYLTAAIGSSGLLERFTADYDLPNDTAYGETCASIGLARFGIRMARLTGDASYIDIVERALYNNIRAGIALTGDRYFYVNVLEMWPDICIPRTSREHVKPVRQKWFDVACCPTNIARTFASLGEYLYSANADSLYVNLYISNKTTFTMSGKQIELEMQTDYPNTGKIKIHLSGNSEFTLSLRIPGYAQNFSVSINGNPVQGENKSGFFMIKRLWIHETVEISFDIHPILVYANPLVRANSGKVALLRGPEVYCLEEMENGKNLSAISIRADAQFIEEWRPDLLGGTMVVHTTGYRLLSDKTESCQFTPPQKQEIRLTAVPYGSWCNREPGEMIVWIRSE